MKLQVVRRTLTWMPPPLPETEVVVEEGRGVDDVPAIVVVTVAEIDVLVPHPTPEDAFVAQASPGPGIA